MRKNDIYLSKVKLRLIIFYVWRIIYMTNRISDKNTIVIFTAKLARNLLKNGFTIVDIKPDRTDEDNK